jgi:hypothetical protein
MTFYEYIIFKRLNIDFFKMEDIRSNELFSKLPLLFLYTCTFTLKLTGCFFS